jgi:DNA-directed RNA polymerase specialized sigma24 family protein
MSRESSWEGRERIFRFAFLMLGDPLAANDVAREAVRRAGAYIPTDEALGELYGAALDLCHRRMRDANHDQPLVSSLDEVFRRPVPQPETAALQAEHQRLAVVSGGLLPGLREVFILRFVEGLSAAAVARACRISVDAVRARCERARSLLRTDLADLTRYLSPNVQAQLQTDEA